MPGLCHQIADPLITGLGGAAKKTPGVKPKEKDMVPKVTLNP